MKKFMVWRAVPGIGKLDLQQLRQRSEISNQAVARLAPHVQWLNTYVADDGIYCVYLARHEQEIHRHGELIGVPADRVDRLHAVIDPSITSGLGVWESGKA